MKTTINPLFIAFLLMSTPLIFAQDPFDPGQDPGAAAAPISDCIIPMLVLGIGLGFFFFKKRKTA
jgi:hypothetical protein